MEPPHSESIAYLFRELVKQLPRGLKRSEIEDAANLYVQQETEFSHRHVNFTPREIPITKLQLHVAPAMVNTRTSKRERQDKGVFPPSALLIHSWMDAWVQLYVLESRNELLTSIEFRESMEFKRLDFQRVRVVDDLREPEIDEVEYELQDIDGIISVPLTDKE